MAYPDRGVERAAGLLEPGGLSPRDYCADAARGIGGAGAGSARRFLLHPCNRWLRRQANAKRTAHGLSR